MHRGLWEVFKTCFCTRTREMSLFGGLKLGKYWGGLAAWDQGVGGGGAKVGGDMEDFRCHDRSIQERYECNLSNTIRI